MFCHKATVHQCILHLTPPCYWPWVLMARSWPWVLMARSWPWVLMARSWPWVLMARSWPWVLMARSWPWVLMAWSWPWFPTCAHLYSEKEYYCQGHNVSQLQHIIFLLVFQVWIQFMSYGRHPMREHLYLYATATAINCLRYVLSLAVAVANNTIINCLKQDSRNK